MELAAHSGEVVEEVLVGVKDLETGEHSQVEGSAACGKWPGNSSDAAAADAWAALNHMVRLLTC